MPQYESLDPFPELPSHPSPRKNNPSLQSSAPRRRRKSSSLPGEPRGDTGAAALSTISDQQQDEALNISIQRTASEKARPHSKRRKAKTLFKRCFKRWKTISLRHTWLNPLIICLIVILLYAMRPSPDNPLHAALFLSYPISSSSYPQTDILYEKGGRDFAFVAFYTIVLSFTREFLMQRVIRPLAIRFGVKGRAKQSRFMEQFYTAIYFAIFGPYGLYVMKKSPVWYFNTVGMFEGFPHRQHEGIFKAYYLLQAAYWSQQAIVLLLQLEKPRKDFKELVGHHIITLSLIWLSYSFHFAYMGLAVYITHDISDFFLATSKVLNYIESPIVGPYFGLFILVWAYCRHYLNIKILYAVLTEFATIGPFELDWGAQQYKCWISQYITFALLASLQSVNIFWFVLILRIAKNYIITNVAEDERSDYGSDDESLLDGSGSNKQSDQIMIEDEMQIPPQVLLNGMPFDEPSRAVATDTSKVAETQVRERKRSKRG